MSKFDWNYYLGGSVEDGLEASNPETIDVYLDWTKASIPGSEKLRVLRPWKATYWKSLPEGVRVRYKGGSRSLPGGMHVPWPMAGYVAPSL